MPSQRLGVRDTDQAAVVVPLLSERAVRASREGRCRPGAGCSGGGWLVTAPHQKPASVSRGRAPWGTFHFKENGGLLTACGEYAVAWHVFWGLEVNPLERQACRVCARMVLGQFGDFVDRFEGWT
ncbi:hypothetical protein [Nocardioides cavernaquae]|uniref:hypothetical protein n=1 Tax=Nocardioides cavernaquae TaxID=2321396 RepID=UPI0011C436D1|nr:hypothetical protein [Nocardioides cavernaquae]